jgi:multisubunit Na+/H+ antiporter MnhB subunit
MNRSRGRIEPEIPTGRLGPPGGGLALLLVTIVVVGLFFIFMGVRSMARSEDGLSFANSFYWILMGVIIIGALTVMYLLTPYFR